MQNKQIVGILHKVEMQGEDKFRYQIDNLWFSGKINAASMLKHKVCAEYNEMPNPKSSYPYRNITSIELSANIENSKDAFWMNKEKRDILTSSHIQRHGALNTALEIKRLSCDGVKTGQTVEQIMQEAKALAEDIIIWVKSDGR